MSEKTPLRFTMNEEGEIIYTPQPGDKEVADFYETDKGKKVLEDMKKRSKNVFTSIRTVGGEAA